MSDYLRYIPRIRSYYQALGYGAPYVWAHQDEVPFARLGRPLAQARIGLVTTAAPFQPDGPDQSIGAPVTGDTKFFEVLSLPSEPVPDLRLVHVAYDTTHTTHDDPGTFNPLAALAALARDGAFAALGPRVHCVPTNRSQSTTRDVYAPEVLRRCREDGLDAVVLVPICPVCHQTVTLVSGVLEAAGLPTVIMGAARDIVEEVGAPRLLHSNMPLGNPCGPPDDAAAQQDTARRALALLETAQGPRTVETSPHRWPGAADWQKDYSNADLLSAEAIATRRAAFDAVKAKGQAIRQAAPQAGFGASPPKNT